MPTFDIAWLVQMSDWFDRIAQFTVLAPLLAGVPRWKHLSPVFRPVLWCCLMWAVLMVAAYVSARLWRYNVVFWHLVSLLELLLLGLAYYRALPVPRLRRFMRWGVGPAAACAVADSLFWSGLWHMNIYFNALHSGLLVALALLYFEHLTTAVPIQPAREPLFLVSVGVLLYFAGTVLVFTLQPWLRGPEYPLLMNVNAALSIVLNLCLARALQLAGRPPAAPRAPVPWAARGRAPVPGPLT